MSDELPDLGAFGAAFQDFMRAMTVAAERPESPLAARLRQHLGVDVTTLPTTSVEFSTTDRPNLQLALDAVLQDRELIGYATPHMGMAAMGISELLAAQSMTGPIRLGPVQYNDVEVGDGRVIRCVASGIVLANHAGAPIVLTVSGGRKPPFGHDSLNIEGVSPDEEAISDLVRALRAAMREHNVYRGKVISLHGGQPQESISVRFHKLDPVARDEVVLPDGTLERLERHALGIAEQADRLQRSARHLKRGILLHGPPGTGKTLSVNYLLGAMPDRTTILLTGGGLGLIEQAFAIARELAPATVVLEDIDLVAAERTLPFGPHGLLFELLNQMEGLAEDGDLLFLLTTNRPDLIEPALAARPGRVDLALELPLPDDAARLQLVRLFARDTELNGDVEQDVVSRTEGVSGAFIKELLRQAALRAALDDRQAAGPVDLTAALDELLEERSALTRRLLGQPAHGSPGGTPAPLPLPSMLHAFGAAGLAVPPNPLDD